MAPITVPGRLPSPPSTQIANTRPIYSRPTEGSIGWMMIKSAPATDVVAIEMPKAMRLMRVGSTAHQPQGELVLRHRGNRAPDEGARQEELQRGEQGKRGEARHQHAQRKIHHAEAPSRPDIPRLDIAVVDAEDENEHHLGDEQEAEEEREAAQRFLPVLLERLVVDLVDAGAEQIEHRHHDDADQDRVDAEAGVDDIGDVGAENDEGGMRDVDDVEDAERDRDADGHGGIEAAEQNAGDQGVDQQIEATPTCSPRSPVPARSCSCERAVFCCDASVQEGRDLG